MAELISETPAGARLPVEIGGAVLSELTPTAITWIAPFKGKRADVEREFSEKTGCLLPKPNSSTESEQGRALSVGPAETLYFGSEPELSNAAVVDQSDAWAVLHLAGSSSINVLARVTSIDLRRDVFTPGSVARTMVGHMNATILKLSDDHYEILVFRSMCKTAIHDLTRAMRAVEARASLRKESDKNAACPRSDWT